MKDRKRIKSTAWKYFAKYIRIKECIETTGSDTFGKCCDCGKIHHISYLDAGHFVSGRKDAYLFLEDMVHIQCQSCNRTEQKRHQNTGVSERYYFYMVDRYGQERTNELMRMKFSNDVLHVTELEEIRDYYKNKLKELEI